MLFSLRPRGPFDDLRDALQRNACANALAEFKDPALRRRNEAARHHVEQPGNEGHAVQTSPSLVCLSCGPLPEA